MKDAIHHLKHVQKKVIQSARKNNNTEVLETKSVGVLNSEQHEEMAHPKPAKRSFHLPQQSSIH